MHRCFSHVAVTASAVALLGGAAVCTVPAHAGPAVPKNRHAGPAQGTRAPGAALRRLAAQVAIPYERFVLPNGLTTIVHTDRKAPVVGVTVYYRVGSRDEPRGHAGFAHLYEHLFFLGSAHAPAYTAPLKAAGSTTPNGSTYYDRTNYVETVPSGALDLALFLESDRMGWLLPALTQDKLERQRGVVENEKRQNDNQPYGLMHYAVSAGLFPPGHPYRHEPIGAKADLDAASLGDVRQWFADHYGPNNAVLVLSGDIDAATARPMVEQWFGAIARGPAVAHRSAGPVTLAAPVHAVMTDRVPAQRLTRNWSGPGLNDRDAAALRVGMAILGGMNGSYLERQLVRGPQVALAAGTNDTALQDASVLQASIDVKPGQDRSLAGAALDRAIAAFLRDGPSRDEVERAVTGLVAERIGALELVGGFGGKGAVLAEGEVYSGDPAHEQRVLRAMVALSPERVRDAMRRWLSRPVYALDVVPGARTLDGAAMGGDQALPVAATTGLAQGGGQADTSRSAPPVAPVGAVAFPAVQHATLSNGMRVDLARRTAVPKVEVAFDAGYAADAFDTPGTQAMMLRMLREGTAERSGPELLAAQQRLGAQIGASAALDTSSVNLDALSVNLAPSLALMAEMIRHPAFRDADVLRIRQQQRAQLALSEASPGGRAERALLTQIYGSHPYAQPANGMGTIASIEALDGAALRKAHQEWLRPGKARIMVVGDVTMAALLPMLEQAFGGWSPVAAPGPVKDVSVAVGQPRSRIILIDNPGAPQSEIMAGRVLPLTGRDRHQEALGLANALLGGDFLSRLNLDLREKKGWSYGVRSEVTAPAGPRALLVSAPVQSDRTGAALAAIIADMQAFATSAPVEPGERDRVVEGAVRSLTFGFETNGQVLGALERNALLGRPDDYYAGLQDVYRGAGTDALRAAATRYLSPRDLVYVVVGDRQSVEPQLRGLGLPVDVEDEHGKEEGGMKPGSNLPAPGAGGAAG
jgi:zinc protease